MKSLFEKYEIKKVFIEKQIKANVIAKSIESCIGTLSIVLGAIPYIYDPKTKFSYLNPKYNSKKKEHKKIVQEYARTILTTYGYETKYFDSFTKKDDIADALCMVIFSWYEEKTEGFENIKSLLLNKYLIK